MNGDGVFVDCQTHWKGRIGGVAVSFAKYRGGVFAIGEDGEDAGVGLKRATLRIGARVRLVCRSEEGAGDHGQSVLIRQEHDPAPKFSFLEEGPARIGMRVAFDLLDEAGHYHGDGRQDVWVYPEGDLHITVALHVVDLAGHGAVQDCALEVEGAKGNREVRIGERAITPAQGEVTVPFGEALPGKSLILAGGGRPAALYWVRDRGHAWPFTSDHGKVPPFYASHWPTGMQQWAWEGMGWGCGGAGASVRVGESGPEIRMAWLKDGATEGEVRIGATLIVSVADDVEDLKRRIEAVQSPLTPEVFGGNFRNYTEEDGTYEVGQGDPTRVVVRFPADPLERCVRVRLYRRKTDPRHRGAVVARVNGEAVRPNLMSEGELTDDICVVMEMSPRNDSVDDVIVPARLRKDGPTEVVIEKMSGIQATYQAESAGLDLQRRAGNRRDLVIWNSHNPERPAFELDLFSCAVHRPTAHGRTAPALWEMPMAWFKSCGISKHHYCNSIKAFSVEKNGPDEVRLYARGTNPNQRAQSELWIRMPYDHPRWRMEVRMRMEVLKQWDYPNVEFSDIFPSPSRLVETWFHDAVLFVQRDKASTVYTYRPDTSYYDPRESEDDRLFYGLFATDRGNVLTLFRNLQHPTHKLHYAVCGNYVDIHVNLHPGEVPVPQGKVFEVEYVCELYGDGKTSADEIRQIGLRSLEAGDIVIE